MSFETFLKKEKSLYQGFIKNQDSIVESYLKHTQFIKNNLMPITSNQTEIFHNIPLIRQLKKHIKNIQRIHAVHDINNPILQT